MGGRLLIAKHLGPSLRVSFQKQGSAVRSYLLHSSLAAQPFASGKCAGPKAFSKSNRHVLTFFNVQGPIVSTAGDVLNWQPNEMAYSDSYI